MYSVNAVIHNKEQENEIIKLTLLSSSDRLKLLNPAPFSLCGRLPGTGPLSNFEPLAGDLDAMAIPASLEDPKSVPLSAVNMGLLDLKEQILSSMIGVQALSASLEAPGCKTSCGMESDC